MLYLFYGENSIEASKKARGVIDSLRAKRPDAAFEKIDAQEWNESVMQGHLGGQGLFSNKYIIFLDHLSENSEAKEKLGELIPLMQESANIFIALEGKLNTDLKKVFEKNAEKILEFEKKTSDSRFAAGSAKKDFNIFALGDALGSRDAYKTWSIYRQAIENGLEPENILGTLFWQMKSIALSANAKSAGESGLNPFVYSKSKRYAALFSQEDLAKCISDLVVIYHDGHRGLLNMELGLEKWILGMNKKH